MFSPFFLLITHCGTCPMHRYDKEGIKSLLCVRGVSSKDLFVCVCVWVCIEVPPVVHRHHTHTVYMSFKWNYISLYKCRLASVSSFSFTDISALIRNILIFSDCNTQCKWVVGLLSLYPIDFNECMRWQTHSCLCRHFKASALSLYLVSPHCKAQEALECVYCLDTLTCGIM